ncbi:hypothetical protein [Mycobacterium tuberculosis]|nr:hypothetical protein [Mycobacterium tuberculosis]
MAFREVSMNKIREVLRVWLGVAGLIGAVADAVRPARPDGHGAAWEQLLGVANCSLPPGNQVVPSPWQATARAIHLVIKQFRAAGELSR